MVKCALGSAAWFAMGAGASVLLVGTATPPASELVRWSAFMPWAEITHFPPLSPYCTHGSSLAEAKGSMGSCGRLPDMPPQLSALFPPFPAAPCTAEAQGTGLKLP